MLLLILFLAFSAITLLCLIYLEFSTRRGRLYRFCDNLLIATAALDVLLFIYAVLFSSLVF